MRMYFLALGIAMVTSSMIVVTTGAHIGNFVVYAIGVALLIGGWLIGEYGLQEMR